MNILADMKSLLSRWWRIRKVTTVASQYSRQAFPQDKPVWSMIAEDQSDQCVVYVTYERRDNRAQSLPHRFFKVRLPDLSVIDLKSEYYPAQWGPYR